MNQRRVVFAYPPSIIGLFELPAFTFLPVGKILEVFGPPVRRSARLGAGERSQMRVSDLWTGARLEGPTMHNGR